MNVDPVLSKLNIICLPHKDFEFKGDKMAVIAGRGYTKTMSIAPRRVYMSTATGYLGKRRHSLEEREILDAGKNCEVRIYMIA